MTRLASFAANVGVNVLANLLAAAAIYIAGVLLGIFPSSHALIVGATVTVALGGFWPALVLIAAQREASRKLAMCFFNILMGLIFVLSEAVSIGFQYLPFPGWFTVTLGSLAIVGGLAGIPGSVSRLRRDRSNRRRIKGLHWFDSVQQHVDW